MKPSLNKIENLKNLYFHNLNLNYSLREIENIFLELLLYKKQWKKVDFLLNQNQLLKDKEIAFMQLALQKLKKNIPVQHIIGYVYFNELIFAFSIAVLIASLDISIPVHLALENIFFKANMIQPEPVPMSNIAVGELFK